LAYLGRSRQISHAGARGAAGRCPREDVRWRATGSLDTFVVAALVTGNSRLACGVALAEILTKTALYYVHERAWALIPWGRR